LYSDGAGLQWLDHLEGVVGACICTLKARGCVRNDGNRPVSPQLHAAMVVVAISSLGMLFSCQGGEVACVLVDG